MANYDQSGNPVGGTQHGGQQQQAGQSGAQQGGSHTTGQAGAWQGGQGSQQSQYSTSTQRQGESGGRGMTQRGGSGMPDLYSGFAGGPFQLISRLSDEMDRIFEGFGFGPSWPRIGGQSSGRGGQGLRTLWAPHIELSERNGKLLIQADLPGVRKEDVDVQIEDDAVIIQGQRHQENERNEGGVYHTERSYGSFYRMIPERPRGRRLEIGDGNTGQGQVGSNTASGSTSSPSGQQQAEGSSQRR